MFDRLSIVIPAYNRSAALCMTLESLTWQEASPADLEVIVVDDGSTDDTPSVVSTFLGKLPLIYIRQENRGAGAARNRGLHEARGQIVLFLDSDIAASPVLVAEHLRYHELHPHENTAILGHVVLGLDIAATPLNLRHAIHRWRGLVDGQPLDWQYFITSNISLKKSFLVEHHLLFDEELSNYEDTELGYRCEQHGLSIRYNPWALGYHNHELSFEAALKMGWRYGRSLALIHHRHPELRQELGSYLVPQLNRGPKRVARRLIRSAAINRITFPIWLHLGRRTSEEGPISWAVRSLVINYCERLGYAEGQRALREQPG